MRVRLLGVSGLPSKQALSHLPARMLSWVNATVPHSSGWLGPSSLPHAVAHAYVEAYLLGDLNNAVGQIQSAEWSITA